MIDHRLSRGEGAALWRQIADTLEGEIKAGGYSDEDGRLPTERELTERFSVNRHTVRRALASLSEVGLVRTEQGRGVFVNKELVPYPLGRRVRFSENLSKQRHATASKILDIEVLGAPADVAAPLDLDIGDRVWRIERMNYVEHRPVMVASHYFSHRRFPNLDEAFDDNISITRALAKFGVTDYERRETRITARPATAEEARTLDLHRGRPVLVTEGVNVDMDGRPLEFGITRFAADRMQLVV